MSKIKVSAGPGALQTLSGTPSWTPPSFCGLLASFGAPWLAAGSLQSVPLSSHGTLPVCLSTHSTVSLNKSGSDL